MEVDQDAEDAGWLLEGPEYQAELPACRPRPSPRSVPDPLESDYILSSRPVGLAGLAGCGGCTPVDRSGCAAPASCMRTAA